MRLVLTPRRLTTLLGGIALALSAVSVFFWLLRPRLPSPLTTALHRLTYMDYEQNIPTWYASGLLLACALLLFIIARHKRLRGDRYTGHWYGLAALFVFCSIDEIVSIHERLTDPLRQTYGLSGLLYFSWVVVGLAVVVALALIYARFLRDLEPRARGHFLLAGLVFLSGAIGVEMIGGPVWELSDGSSVLSALLIHVEETLELAGVLLFLYALNS
jgi:hypothetical protein